ncbi:unnamed protein product [Alopecurus aequalis]
MASSASRMAMAMAVVLLVLAAAQPGRAGPACYTRMFSFGDSLADTGNYRFVYPNQTYQPMLRLPYGETYFNKATGRFSNGRIMLDFIADTLGLPFVPPYLGGRSVEDFAAGANFAVGRATALSPAFFGENGAPIEADTVHLDMEMGWFRDLLNLFCPNDLTDCADMIDKSLFLVGEIGGNDYNTPFFNGVPFETIRNFTPSVVAKISSTITELIGIGAKTLLVPGNLPIGCNTQYLKRFSSNKAEDYEPGTSCIHWLNEFAQYHNELLVDELQELRKLHPGVAIIYADYYGAAMEIFVSPENFGIDYPLVACCGEGTYGVPGGCGVGEYKVCDDPQKYGYWDGIHPTEVVYKIIAEGLLRGSYTQPPIATTTNSCPQLSEIVSSVEYKAIYDL